MLPFGLSTLVKIKLYRLIARYYIAQYRVHFVISGEDITWLSMETA